MDHTTLRAQLVFAIAYVAGQSRQLLRRIAREHTADDASQLLGERVVQHLELSGFDIDEADQTIRKRPPAPPHG
jgi:hypothetical protein